VKWQRYSESDVDLGRGYNLSSHLFQDAAGARALVPVQATRLGAVARSVIVQAEEMRFEALAGDTDPGGHLIIIDANGFNINLRTIHDALYGLPQEGDEVTCIVNAGVTIGSVSTSLPAFNVGTWPDGVDITVIVNGELQGCGGNGGTGSTNDPASNGGPGGTALYTRRAIDLELPTSGHLWGGGGGGGGGFTTNYGGGGGGGAGTNSGSGSNGGFGAIQQGVPGSSGSSNGGGGGGLALLVTGAMLVMAEALAYQASAAITVHDLDLAANLAVQVAPGARRLTV
jgi:hypothetical protein